MSRSSATSLLCTAVARTTDPTITVIVDPDDDLSSLEQLRRLHARPYGQILCEPDPTATSTELARYVLQALGKGIQSGTRGELWTHVTCHLRTEHVRDIAVVRAHTLTYAALRDLSNHAHDAGSALWLLLAAERPPPAVVQLLEVRPHHTADLRDLITRWTSVEPSPDDDRVPPGAGPDYPYLTPIQRERPLSRAGLCAKLRRHDRALIARTWNATQAWVNEWLDTHPDKSDGELATAIYNVTAAGDTASELLTRAQAAINAVRADGIPVNRDLLRHDLRLQFVESRPYEWRQVVELTTVFLDQIADPQLGAMLVLGAVYRAPANVCRIKIKGIAPDGSIAYSDYGGVRAVPPQLRAALAAHREQLLRTGDSPNDPYLPGPTGGRMSAQSIEQALLALAAPRSIWDGGDEEYFDGPELDGRTTLHRLDQIALFNPPPR